MLQVEGLTVAPYIKSNEQGEGKPTLENAPADHVP